MRYLSLFLILVGHISFATTPCEKVYDQASKYTVDDTVFSLNARIWKLNDDGILVEDGGKVFIHSLFKLMYEFSFDSPTEKIIHITQIKNSSTYYFITRSKKGFGLYKYSGSKFEMLLSENISFELNGKKVLSPLVSVVNSDDGNLVFFTNFQSLVVKETDLYAGAFNPTVHLVHFLNEKLRIVESSKDAQYIYVFIKEKDSEQIYKTNVFEKTSSNWKWVSLFISEPLDFDYVQVLPPHNPFQENSGWTKNQYLNKEKATQATLFSDYVTRFDELSKTLNAAQLYNRGTYLFIDAQSCVLPNVENDFVIKWYVLTEPNILNVVYIDPITGKLAVEGFRVD